MECGVYDHFTYKTLNPKPTIIITTLKNKGVGGLQTFKFCENNKKINQTAKNQTSPISFKY
jgi:hypothetical protein